MTGRVRPITMVGTPVLHRPCRPVEDFDAALRELADDHGWTMPLGQDRDGALANLYRVGGCPTFVFATGDARLYDVVIGELNSDELLQRVDELIAAERERLRGGAKETGRKGN